MLAVKRNISGIDKTIMNIANLKLEWKEKNILIVGCGVSGISCANFLSRNDIKFSIIDSRTNIKNISNINQRYTIKFGDFQENDFSTADIIIVSPGVSIKHPFIQKAIAEGKEVFGDVDLFCRLVDAPIIAITGSNGKSTVTTLVGDILNASNINAKVGGNIGVPCLDLLSLDLLSLDLLGQDHFDSDHSYEAKVDCYVLELSSFQLETTSHLKAYASVILNLSEDHMDRYDSFLDYCNAKQRILNDSKYTIINLDDKLASKLSHAEDSITFSLSTKADFTLGLKSGKEWIFHNEKPFLDISKLRIVGQHNKSNILAAISLCSVFDIALDKTAQAINTFSGLEHRSQLISNYKNVQWINDSKATNVGATRAALNGFSNRPLYLILGGQSKGQDFNELLPVLTNNIKQIFIYGEDSDLIANSIKEKTKISIQCLPTLKESINEISKLVIDDDVVLFSPACASFDQFDNYMHRGQSFVQYVNEVAK